MQTPSGSYQQKLRQHMHKFNPNSPKPSSMINIQNVNISLNTNNYTLGNEADNSCQAQTAVTPKSQGKEDSCGFQKHKRSSDHGFADGAQKSPQSSGHAARMNSSFQQRSILKSIVEESEALNRSKPTRAAECFRSQVNTQKLWGRDLQESKLTLHPPTIDNFNGELQKQNLRLKEENQILKQGLNQLKKSSISAITSHRLAPIKESNDRILDCDTQLNRTLNDRLNDTIGDNDMLAQKQSYDFSEISIRMEVTSKQCQIYQEIIDKMQNKIRKLSAENRKLVEQLRSQEYMNSVIRELEFQVDNIFREYQHLEQALQCCDEQWHTIKDQWIGEREHYLSRIEELELDRINQKYPIEQRDFQCLNEVSRRRPLHESDVISEEVEEGQRVIPMGKQHQAEKTAQKSNLQMNY